MSAIFTEERGISGSLLVTASGPSPPRRDSRDWQARWIMVFFVVGVAIRLIRYLLRFPLWGDEAMLALNFLDRDYAGLMRPLDFHQVAPLLFLWIELTAVKLLGFHEWSLRLFPLLCGLASLFFFYRLAKLLLRGTALVLAVGVFAVTYSSLRYATEVKPYAVDLMVSTLLLLLAVRCWRQPDQTRWLWALAAFVPLALGLSHPAVFVAGGVSLAVAAALLRTRSWRGWWVWGVYNLALAGSFLAWYKLTIGAQAGAELDVMTPLWSDAFPPRDSLIGLLAWLVRVHAGPLLAVPLGGDNWGSIGTTLLCLVAVGALVRRPPTADLCAVPGCPGARRYWLLLLCSAPFALNLIAAAIGRFPYGGHMRLTMHLTPLVCILVGIGATAVIKRFRRSRLPSGTILFAGENDRSPKRKRGGNPSPRSRFRLLWPWRKRLIFAREQYSLLHARRNASSSLDMPTSPAGLRAIVPSGRKALLGAVIAMLLALAALSTARDFYSPGKEQKEIRKRDFAVWFWGSMERDHEVVCLNSDPKEISAPASAWREHGVSPQFLCNERIYSPRRARGQVCDLSRVSRQRPLACVQYWTHFAPYDQAAFQRWLDGMKQRYELIATEYYPMLEDNDDNRVHEPPDRVEVYEFVPKGS